MKIKKIFVFFAIFIICCCFKVEVRALTGDDWGRRGQWHPRTKYSTDKKAVAGTKISLGYDSDLTKRDWLYCIDHGGAISGPHEYEIIYKFKIGERNSIRYGRRGEQLKSVEDGRGDKLAYMLIYDENISYGYRNINN